MLDSGEDATSHQPTLIRGVICFENSEATRGKFGLYPPPPGKSGSATVLDETVVFLEVHLLITLGFV